MDRPDLALHRSDPLWARFQEPGDIVLTTGAGPGAVANRLVQSLVEGRWARATHAMLVAAPGLYLDAGPREGAALVPADRYAFAPVAGEGLRRRRLVAVLRHPELAGSAGFRRDLARAIGGFCGAGYNFRFFLGPSRGADGRPRAFCSELVAAVFERVGRPLVPDRPAHTVLPHTLLAILPPRGWRDVAPLWARALGCRRG